MWTLYSILKPEFCFLCHGVVISEATVRVVSYSSDLVGMYRLLKGRRSASAMENLLGSASLKCIN